MIAQVTRRPRRRPEWTRLIETQADCRCPRCGDAQWIKVYTPWGCPDSVPCPRCAGKVGHCPANHLPSMTG